MIHFIVVDHILWTYQSPTLCSCTSHTSYLWITHLIVIDQVLHICGSHLLTLRFTYFGSDSSLLWITHFIFVDHTDTFLVVDHILHLCGSHWYFSCCGSHTSSLWITLILFLLWITHFTFVDHTDTFLAVDHTLYLCGSHWYFSCCGSHTSQFCISH